MLLLLFGNCKGAASRGLQILQECEWWPLLPSNFEPKKGKKKKRTPSNFLLNWTASFSFFFKIFASILYTTYYCLLLLLLLLHQHIFSTFSAKREEMSLVVATMDGGLKIEFPLWLLLHSDKKTTNTSLLSRSIFTTYSNIWYLYILL